MGPGERTLVQDFAAHDLRTRDDHFFVLRGPQVRHLQAHLDDISDGVAEFDQVRVERAPVGYLRPMTRHPAAGSGCASRRHSTASGFWVLKASMCASLPGLAFSWVRCLQPPSRRGLISRFQGSSRTASGCRLRQTAY